MPTVNGLSTDDREDGDRGPMRFGTEEFFDELERRGYDPRLRHVTCTVRFDIGGATWLLSIDDGNLTVDDGLEPSSRRDADCVVRSDRWLFDRIVRGETAAITAMLRGELIVRGDPEELVLVQRLLPGPRHRPWPARA